MQNWVVIDENYLNYLRNAEYRIPYSNYGDDKYKPFFGVLFEKGDLFYVTQISHPKPRHSHMKNSPDFIKIYAPNRGPEKADELIAVVNLNYMFPVHKSLIKKLEYRDIEQHRTFSSQQEKSKYIDLLTKELALINQLGVDEKAKRLYERKVSFPADQVSLRCLDFCYLEKLAEKYVSPSE
ncbi:MAG: type III toxin-antitoxin system ToxN/AbiQ family toxin [Eubacteriales bacterium]|nr:type III toxin-antitoxin system ToxN/AbiQ family toxin [Clostridium sp.]MDD7503801.1 type III toxin-antitoxin system ToxN/AbiQ family toxin [Clostridium sp.]MDY6089297.1 type III toxin-antitoxin system ToxN/AbiQ family toxin [Eubacteriales bacterium]